MHFKHLALAFGVAGPALAQRPSDTSICDYYTTALFTDNTPSNQYSLLTALVNTVVIGNYSACSVGGGLAGILAPAYFGGENVNLLPYFNGCLKSTNGGGKPVSVNFLDGGGAAPLMQNMPANSADSNQYGLLTHLYQFFGKLLGCSGYGQMGFPSYMGDPSMARVHKFMALDSAEVGYFISQVGAAATCFGVSSSDVSSVAGVLMQYFGYRCSPPLAITDGAQLQSICEDCSCPYDPNAQCGLYDHGGCYPEPMTASQCMSGAPTGYGSSTYSSMKYQPTYSSKDGKASSKYEKTKTPEYDSKTKSSQYEHKTKTSDYYKPTTTSKYKQKTSKYSKPTTSEYYDSKTKSSEYDHKTKTSSKEYMSTSTWGEKSSSTWGKESSSSIWGESSKYTSPSTTSTWSKESSKSEQYKSTSTY
ncbi:hypothetical protein LTR70_009501 [Exophiala xenobiotica]|uniref:Uncharacterized protein n=1 Tax=Lithohypha guttulata TaxID=1690604 RepID=A0ABR0JXF3_9EURO|nr:hypothetical protein LTR24_009411 [Lithohypha guttulata]KAK5310395.1 hypothetical protein LTR70_009501 [Exophiala xenobiotica]